MAFRVEPDSSPAERDGYRAFGCAPPRGEERSLAFAPGALDEDVNDAREAGREVTVEAIRTGYRPAQLAAPATPEVAVQRAFVERFPG